ncbi:hypothetical protein JRO89_XS15G0010000 [Xanthoceras sorbifolium]|uniref:Disease resistance protein RGA3 n=1 Tax=Xanthoceras sorbifolium TaxID=99658 RepID=A0ABQ8H0M1_9ROSI|nr:hypothetical protein JRO89_XS15G0010000 [Xanthoceras sorbifolium]
MADALFEFLLGKLDSLIQKEVGLIWGVDREMKRLQSLLSTIQAVLEDAEEKQIKEKALRDWLRKLKAAAYKVDDILDGCATEAALLESKGQYSSLTNEVLTSFFSSLRPHNILFRHKIGSRMRDIRERLDETAEERSKFHLIEGGAERRSDVITNRQTGSVLTQSRVYGRDEDKARTVECLVEKVSGFDGVSVYPIVGLGGLGKTTLAQTVINDERIGSHFELRIWVCVSEDFSVRRIIKAIIESATRAACEDLQLDPLQKRLQEILNRKRYLLVLDNVWNEDRDNWESLKSVLACGSKGASVIVTTRITTVASFMGTMPLHQLSGLTEDDCWSLFKERAFGHETEERPNLVELGKKIVKKCGGVPLAVKCLGSMMNYRRDESQWLSVVKSELWTLPQPENSILPALRLSYSNLPSKLRQCFAFCAIFPKDFVIEKEFLIQLWMASGFIPFTESLDPEDIGNEFCNELCWRSFLEDLGEDDYGFSKGFKMHDLVHDLAQSIMEDECLIQNIESSANVPKRTFHYASIGNLLEPYIFPNALYQVETLRTFILHNLSWSNDFAFSCDFSRLSSLRVLDARECLDFGFPSGLSETKNLSSSISRLTHLREVVSLNLGGMLHIRNLRSVENPQDAKEANLVEKRNLRKLYLSWTNYNNEDDDNNLPSHEEAEKVLEALKPHANLVEFVISGYIGAKFPFWMGDNILNNVVSIKLEDCHNCSQLPPLALLPSLRYLVLSRMSQVVYIDDHFQSDGTRRGFPSLQSLTIENLPSLQGFSREDCRELFPCLTSLQIQRCPKLTLPHLPSVELLNVSDCNEVVLGSISNLKSLIWLSVSDNSELSYLPHGMLLNLTSLKELHISSFWKLKCLPTELVSLTALETLEIWECHEFESLPEQGMEGLKCLKYLFLGECFKLTSLPGEIQHLSCLETLTLTWCSELEALPDGIKYLTSLHMLELRGIEWAVLPEVLRYVPALQFLWIMQCPNLASLPHWLGDLTSLQALSIQNCPELTSLPASIQGLKNLQKLDIVGCPELVKRCEKETGEDWYKISHIPDVYLSTH